MNPPKRRKNTINRYSITEECMVGEEKEKKENYDLMTAVIICLGDSENEHYSGIIKLLDVLLSDEQDPQKKKHILEEDFSVKMTRDLEREVSLMCNTLLSTARSNKVSICLGLQELPQLEEQGVKSFSI